jgi:hypothetical protein
LAWCASPRGAFILIDRQSKATAAAGMIKSAAETRAESAADHLSRLMRTAIPPGAHLDLPSEDDAASAILRDVLQRLLRFD